LSILKVNSCSIDRKSGGICTVQTDLQQIYSKSDSLLAQILLWKQARRHSLEDLIEKARNYAVTAHARINQLRKYTLQPYDVHLKAVAELVASVCDDEEMVAAAWLHDTVEDTPATFEELEAAFGSDVMHLVKELTDVSRPGDGNRAARKAIDREHTALASPRAKTIKLADIIDNCDDICRHDQRFGRVYLNEAKALLDVLSDGDRRLYAKAAQLVSIHDAKLGQISSSSFDQREQSLDTWSSIRSESGHHGIRLFTEAFAARDIQQPLLSVDAETVSRLPFGEWPLAKAAIAGVRENGSITGYLVRDDRAGEQSPRIRQIDQRQLVGLESSLVDVIHVLTHFTYCFVELEGTVVGVISRVDIEKPVVRMWLFGFIILIEVQVVELIRVEWPDNGWVGLVSEGRLEKARQLQSERMRRGYPADLLDCLQFSDKLQIAIQNQEFTEALGFGSTSAAKKALKDLESLRNNLAHGQDITRHDWPPIVRLARRIQQLYGG